MSGIEAGAALETLLEPELFARFFLAPLGSAGAGGLLVMVTADIVMEVSRLMLLGDNGAKREHQFWGR